MRKTDSLINIMCRAEAWILSVTLVLLCIFQPLSVSAGDLDEKEPERYHAVTFISTNLNCMLSIGESVLSTPSDYYPDATESNATESSATSADAETEEVLPDGPVYASLSSSSNASPSDVLSGLREVTVFVRSGYTLTEGQIPAVTSLSKYIGVNGWKDKNGYVFRNSELLVTGYAEDTTFYVNSYNKRMLRAYAENTVCVIGGTEYTSLADAVSAAADGAVIEMVVDSYEIPANITITTAKNITITTSSSLVSNCVIRRASAFANNSMLSVNNASAGIRLSNITLDGGWGTDHSGAACTAPLILVPSGTVHLDAGALLKNNYCTSVSSTSTSGAISLTSANSYLYMESGASITNCMARYGGGVTLMTGIFVMNGGSITGCYGTKTSYDCGGAVELWSNGTFTMNGGEISGNKSFGPGGAVVMESAGDKIYLNGGTITGNYATGNNGGLYRYGGNLYLQGGVSVYNNYGGATYSGYTVTSGTSVIRDICTGTGTNANVHITGNITGKIGFYTPSLAADTKFATSSASPASSVTGLSRIYADTNLGSDADLFGIGSTISTDVMWKGKNVCKIGNISYTTLAGAVNAIVAGEAPDINGNFGTSYTDYKIELLTDNVPINSLISIPPGKNVTLTTAEPGTGDLNYSGAAGTYGQITRSTYTGVLVSVPSTSSLTMTGISLDGGWKDDETGVSTANYMISNAGTLNLADNATLKNSFCTAGSSTSGAVYSTGTINMSGSARITHCRGDYGAAISVYGGTLNMSGGTIDHCYSDGARYDSASAIELWGNGGVFNMSGGSITDCAALYATTGGGGAVVQESGTTANLTGGTIENNTGKGACGGYCLTGGTLNVSGPVVIKNNKGSCTYSGNTAAGGITANLYLPSGLSFKTAGEITGSIGVTAVGRMTNDSVFSNTAAESSATVNGLINFFADTNVEQNSASNMFGTYGTGNTVKWRKGVCRIGTVIYQTLEAAVAACANGTAADINGSTGIHMDYKIEMLVPSYEIASQITIPSGKNITVEPAEDAANGVTVCTFTAGSAYTSGTAMFDVPSGTGLTLKKLILNGAGVTNIHGVRNEAGGSLTVTDTTIENFTGTNFRGSGILTSGTAVIDGASVITGNKTSGTGTWTGGAGMFVNGGTATVKGTASFTKNYGYDGGAVSVNNGGVLNIEESASVKNNYAVNPGGGVYLYQSNTYDNGAGGTLNMTGGTIADNFALNYGGGGVFIHSGSTMNLSGGSITGNATFTGRNGGGITLWSAGGNLNVSGSPTVTGNTAGGSMNGTTFVITPGTKVNNTFLNTGTYISVTGNMSAAASVGITAAGNDEDNKDRMTAGAHFGETSSPASSSVENLDVLFRDTNSGTGDLVGAPGTGNNVIWAKAGTCQIIRNGVLIDIYPTIADASAHLQSGDTIEVFKDHTETAGTVIPSTITNVTIKTAPTGTNPVSGARIFQPGAGETSTATVTRDANLKDTSMLTVNGGSVITTGIIFDGNRDNLIATKSMIASAGGATVTLGNGTVIQNSFVANSLQTALGTVNVYGGSTLNVTGAEFKNNRSGMGGAIFSSGINTVTIAGSSFSGNTAVAGGAVMMNGTAGTLSVSDSTFTGNQSTDAGYMGGAIYSNGTFSLSGSTFTGNTAGTGSAIYAARLTMTGVNTISGNTAKKAKGGALYIESTAAGALTMSGTPTITGNTDAGGNASNVKLPSGGMIHAKGSLSGADAAVGVTVADADHISGHKFVHNFETDGTTASREIASSNLPKFRDDQSTELNTGANREQAGDNQQYDTYIYFMPPTRLQFTKKSDGTNHAVISGARFYIYKWLGTDPSSIPTEYATADAMDADTADWQRMTYMNQDETFNAEKGNVFTSDANGNVDCGFLDDKTYRIVEVSTAEGYVLPAGEWNVAVDSSAVSPGKFVFTTIVSGTRNLESDHTYDFSSTETGLATPYSLYNYYANSTLTIKYVNNWAPYANLTKHGTINVVYVGTDNAQHTVTQSIETGHSFTISNIKVDGAVLFTQTDSDGYTITESHVVPAGETITNYGGSDKIWYYKPVRGDTLITITNSRKEIVPTGVEAGQTDPYLWLAGILLWICFLLFRNNHHRKASHK
jgi:fibronectin-binding autotransporter adhesin